MGKVSPTLNENTHRVITQWASEQNRTEANLCGFIIEVVVNLVDSGYQIPGLPPPIQAKNPDKIALNFIRQLSEGEKLDSENLLLISKKLNISLEKLLEIQNKNAESLGKK